jgi:hypothetical protein
MSVINRGLAVQIISNTGPNSRYITGISNCASSHATLDFNDNHELFLLRNYDSYVPYFLILNLFNWTSNHTLTENLASIYSCLDRIHITFNIGYQQILQLPLQLLWGLKTPTIVNNKLYLAVPFDSFFGEIHMNSLVNNDVQFRINNAQELSNYVRNFSLNCKITITNVFLTGYHPQPNHQPVVFIQQLTTLQVNHYNHDVINSIGTNGSNEYCIRTNCFDGLTKGIFISCDVEDLYEIKFYINNILRINYDLFHIQNYCVTLSCNLLYLPFNDSLRFIDKTVESFHNSINFSCLNSSILNLKFNNEQTKVCIHNLYCNEFRYHNGMGALIAPYQPSFIRTDTSIHEVTPIIEDIPSIDLTNMHLMPVVDISGNVINHYSGATGPFANQSGRFSGATGPFISASSHYGPYGPYGPFEPSGPSNAAGNAPIISYKNITDNNRAICNITHELILEHDSYMQCSICHLNYSENALKTWLERRRTCPTCREPWTDNRVYINLMLD